MKRNLILILTLFSFSAFAQQNDVIISGGYVFANLEDYETDAKGWRINALYEFSPTQGPVSHGISVGYIGTTAAYNSVLNTASYKLNS